MLDKLTNESIIFPVQLAVLPVKEPELTTDTHEYVLPGVVEVGVKFNVWFEQMTWVAFVPVLLGSILSITESNAVTEPQVPVAFKVVLA